MNCPKHEDDGARQEEMRFEGAGKENGSGDKRVGLVEQKKNGNAEKKEDSQLSSHETGQGRGKGDAGELEAAGGASVHDPQYSDGEDERAKLHKQPEDQAGFGS